MTEPHDPDALPTCDGCQRRVLVTFSKDFLTQEELLCADCWTAWYNGDGFTLLGGQDPALLKAAVLTKYGPTGGAANLTTPLLALYQDRYLPLRAAAQAVVEAYQAVTSEAAVDTFTDAVHALAQVLRETAEVGW